MPLSRQGTETFCYSPASAVHIRDAVNALIEAGTPYDLELQLVTRSGAHRWVRATGQRAAGTEGHHLYGVFQDITERRNLESEVIRIAQREQNRIGLDLHNGLGQTLAGVSLLLRSASGDVPDSLPHVQQNLREIEGLVSEAVGTCRVLSHGLAPVSQQRGGLKHALQALGMQLKHVHGVKISVEVHGFPRIPESLADQLYRIAQEALMNAVRHAGARHISLTLESNPAQVRLSISDDGGGLLASGITDGLGISIMKYRARLIGAALTFEPRTRGAPRCAAYSTWPILGNRRVMRCGLCRKELNVNRSQSHLIIFYGGGHIIEVSAWARYLQLHQLRLSWLLEGVRTMPFRSR